MCFPCFLRFIRRHIIVQICFIIETNMQFRNFTVKSISNIYCIWVFRNKFLNIYNFHSIVFNENIIYT